MPAFKRFGPGDQVDNVLILEPVWQLSSGTGGWRGSPEGSGSVSLYGGYNRQPGGVVQSYQFQRTIQGTDSFGKLTRSEPITASVNFVYMTDEGLNLAQRSSTRWGHEHWKTIGRLYDYYQRRDPDYVTSSYDYYCLYFNRGSQNMVAVFDGVSAGGNIASNDGMPTGSFTLESWFKPFVTSSYGETFTLLSHKRGYQLCINGSTGLLELRVNSGSAAVSSVVSSSAGPSVGEWHHVAVSFDSSTLSGTFYLDLQNVGSFTLPTVMRRPDGYTGSLTIGGQFGGNVVSFAGQERENYSFSPVVPGALSGTVFHGLIGECRVWKTSRSHAEISSSYSSRISLDDVTGTLGVYLQLREGPLVTASPSVIGADYLQDYAGGGLVGSGVLDLAARVNGNNRADFGNLYSFDDRRGPVWLPSDNTLFYPTKELAPTYVSSSQWSTVLLTPVAPRPVERMLVISIPQGMVGRGIVPKSLELVDNAFSGRTHGLVRTISDDGRGGLFISGSMMARGFNGGYPTTSEEVSYDFLGLTGRWEGGYLCDDLAGTTMSPIFGSAVLTASVDVAPTFRIPGPFANDYAIRFNSGSTPYDSFTASTGSLYDVGANDDLAIFWIARLNESPANGADAWLINKMSSIGIGSGYRIMFWNAGAGSQGPAITTQAGYTLHLNSSGSAFFVGEWHAGLTVFSRASMQARIAVMSLLDGETLATPVTDFTGMGSLTGPTPFRVGGSQGSGVDIDVAALYVTTVSGSVSPSMVTNITGALASMVSSLRNVSTVTRDTHDSVNWNKVGNVFYNEGLVVIRDPALLDFGAAWADDSDRPDDLLQLSFRGESRIPVKTLMCRIDRGDLNASLNSTFYDTEEDGDRIPRHPSGSLYVSTVGIYNSDRELVGVARLAEPLRVRPRDRMNVKLRMDF